MKIGLVRRGFSPTGGAEAYLQRFARAATQAGHPCVLFTDSPWPADAWNAESVRVRGSDPRAFADGLEAARPKEHCDFLLSLERVWRCDAYRAGDGVHAAWLQRRAAIEPRWRNWLRRFNPKHRALLELERSLFAHAGAGHVIANCQLVRREIQAHFSLAPEKISVVYNGLPLPITDPAHTPDQIGAAIRETLGIGAQDYVLLFVGSGWERKGLRFAIRAVQDMPGATLLVAGRGNSRNLPRSPQVLFLGQRRDVSELMQAADAFILPTIYDPFSNACLEALHAGLPVITSRANGFSEILGPELDAGIVADPRDIDALTAAIRHWAGPQRRTEARAASRTLASRFTIEENLRQTFAALGLAA